MKRNAVKVTIKNKELFNIREGLNLLNGIKSLDLGMLRLYIAKEIGPEIEVITESIKNDEFSKLEQSSREIEFQYADDVARRTAELSAINRKGIAIIRDRNRQIKEYEKILNTEIEICIEKIPYSMLPKKEIFSEVPELLQSVINFDK